MIVFAGENTYASYQAAREFAEKLAVNAELVVVDGDEVSNINELNDMIASIGLFGGDKIFFIKRLFKNKGIVKQLGDYPQILASKIIVCWEDGKLDSKLTIVKNLRQHKQTNEFELPKEYQVPDWVMRQGQKYNLSITKNLASEIVNRVGTNLWQLDSELQKLGLYIDVHPGPLSRELVEQIVSDTREQPIWKFLDAVGHKQKDVVLSEFKTLLSQSMDIHYIVAMLNRELRLISQYKYSREHRVPLSLNPYVEKSLASKAPNFTWIDLKRNYLELLQLDTAVKNGEVVDSSALLLYLLNM